MSANFEETRESGETQERPGGPEAEPICPFCQLYAAFLRAAGPQSEFCLHLQMARLEFYKALRSLIDQRIASLEKAAQTSPPKGYQDIKVEKG